MFLMRLLLDLTHPHGLVEMSTWDRMREIVLQESSPVVAGSNWRWGSRNERSLRSTELRYFFNDNRRSRVEVWSLRYRTAEADRQWDEKVRVRLFRRMRILMLAGVATRSVILVWCLCVDLVDCISLIFVNVESTTVDHQSTINGSCLFCYNSESIDHIEFTDLRVE